MCVCACVCVCVLEAAPFHPQLLGRLYIPAEVRNDVRNDVLKTC